MKRHPLLWVAYCRIVGKLRYLLPRRCDYCNVIMFDPRPWVCADCTEARCAAWYAADCPPV